jgi:hypothetical protein
MVDDKKFPTSVWYQFFLAMLNQIGGTAGLIVSGNNFNPSEANQFFAGPVSGGATKPFFRPIETQDLQFTAGAFPGIQNATPALTGNVGEFIGLSIGSPVAMATATPADIGSITLGAGDWDIWANFGTLPAGGASQTLIQAWISTVSVTNPGPPNNGAYLSRGITSGEILGQVSPVGTQQLSLASSLPVYLSAQVTYAGGTMGGIGFIGARRRR